MSGSTRSPHGALIFPITAAPSGTRPWAVPRQRNASRGQAGKHSACPECHPGLRNAFRLSPKSFPDFICGRVETFRAAEALRGVRDEIARTLAGRIQPCYSLVEVHADPAYQPGRAYKLPEQFMKDGVM